MQGTGEVIGKALTKFTDSVFQNLLEQVTGPDFSKADRHWCMWMDDSYPATLKALLKLKQYFTSNATADAYICGYYRGLQEAIYRLQEASDRIGREQAKKRRCFSLPAAKQDHEHPDH